MSSIPLEFAVENYPLAPQTLYHVGGPAKIALIPRNDEEIVQAYRWMKTQNLPRVVLGGGSNVLISDEGFPGIALFSTGLTAIESLGEDGYSVEGGAELDAFLRGIILQHNYEGAGGLTGIPGSVGGAIYMNAGTVNGSICQLLESVQIADEDGIHLVDVDSSRYGYRGQDFCSPGSLVVRGIFRLEKSETDQRAIYDRYIQRRKEKQPTGYSCGSVFKNPTDDHAGRLIEACGLKGTRRGGAVISDLHANFILNDQNGTAADIVALITLAKEAVREKFDIELEEEVKKFGM